MALARTNQIGEIGHIHAVDTYTTGAFTPPDNSLLVVAVSVMEQNGVTDPSADLTISGGSLTFTSRALVGSASTWSMGVRIWTAPVTTGASMTLTAGSTGRNIEFYTVMAVAYTGYNTGTPTAATGTLVDTASPDGATSLTLSGAPATTSEVVAVLGMDKEAVGTTPGAGFTELYDLQDGSSGGGELEIRTGSTSTTVDWVDTHTGTGSIFKHIAVAVEIQAAGAAAGPDANQAIRPIAQMSPFLMPYGEPVVKPLQLMGDAVNVNANVTPAVIVTTSAQPAAVVQTGSTVAPAAVVTATAVNAATVQTGCTATPSVIVTVSAVPSPALSTGETVSPSAVVTVAAVNAPSITAVTAVSPSVVATATAVGSASLSTGETVTPSAVATAAGVSAPTVTADVGADPYQAGPQIAWMFVAPGQSALQLGGDRTTPTAATNATVTPVSIDTATAVNAASLSTGETVAAVAVTTVTALPAPALSTGETVAPASVATVTALPSASVKTGETVLAVAVANVTALPQPGISASGNVTVSPSAIATVTAINAAAVSGSSIVTPAAIATVTALPAPTVKTGSTVAPSQIATVIALPLPSLVAAAQSNLWRAATGTETARVSTGNRSSRASTNLG